MLCNEPEHLAPAWSMACAPAGCSPFDDGSPCLPPSTRPLRMPCLSHVLCRRLLINTGWVPGLPVGSYFRFSNVTVSCTGNLTHPLPPGARREAGAWAAPACCCGEHTRMFVQRMWQQGYWLLATGCARQSTTFNRRNTVQSACADFVDEPDTLLQEHPHLLIGLGVAVLLMAGGLVWCARTSGGCTPWWGQAGWQGRTLLWWQRDAMQGGRQAFPRAVSVAAGSGCMLPQVWLACKSPRQSPFLPS